MFDKKSKIKIDGRTGSTGKKTSITSKANHFDDWLKL
jgi:hypothetical protein